MGHLPGISAVIGLALIAGAGAALADEAGGVRADMCTLKAVVTGKAPKERNVYAAPDAGSAVLSQIEGPYTVGNDQFYPEVEITGSRNGWLRISEAKTNLYIVETPVRVLFEGEGWMRGSGLDLSVEWPQLFSGPSQDTPISATGIAFLDVERLVACEGYWVEVEGTYDGKAVGGWTNDTCASQVTTCP